MARLDALPVELLCDVSNTSTIPAKAATSYSAYLCSFASTILSIVLYKAPRLLQPKPTDDGDLFDFINYRGNNDSRSGEHRYMSAPEHWIYRQDAGFVTAISEVFHDEVLDGKHTHAGNRRPSCRKPEGPGAVLLVNLGVSTVLNKTIGGEVTYSNVASWFRSLAKVMTNGFRSEYRAATFDAMDTKLPLGEVQGLVWLRQTHRIELKDPSALPRPLRETDEDSDGAGREE
ncbi:hypothetical protein HBI56_048160 [Parastagonospora nodorum]|uniref:Uncharacterized protein n=2 Tax=Phaeosphaeria nodorum (strain SN15 / ATCC MYA-4574 / FGSC 10173) TaxID=321614 RepID=A0A7U2ES17_PHANO|nr:hypothetical protein SNOG_02118 [Parastagonospora nodorum SN15]KAH3916626.1 hypothetical protein HBH56_061100 [Parastagonospora nodorum]EAT90330.1 hypothetical protein SNOG_02118 [Parastagonospora nodorum SN15]KAH3930977.1 hypothetical protein HBH54_105030 [Parastagonospora nodorum]KAH3968192.1 hypothetical protein HBH51_133760 [Parastagonospora nodorum]KAH4074090.1 hypothetical protein HBH50_042460 [Parastagonospora nodorum]